MRKYRERWGKMRIVGERRGKMGKDEGKMGKDEEKTEEDEETCGR